MPCDDWQPGSFDDPDSWQPDREEDDPELSPYEIEIQKKKGGDMRQMQIA